MATLTGLLWTDGIGWHTSIRNIGWTWIALAVASIVLAWCVVRLAQEWRR